MTTGVGVHQISEHEVEVRRLHWRGWYLAAIGIVMVLHGGGVLFDWYPTVRILELLYPGREAPGFESRDMAWAATFLIVGVLLIVLTAGRMAVRRPVIRASEDGILLSVGGPFTRPVRVPWGHVSEISVGEDANEFGASPSLLLRVHDSDLVRSQPWGARWNDGVLSIPAEEWECRVGEVAEMLAEARRSYISDMEDASVVTSSATEQEPDPDRAPGSEPEESFGRPEGAVRGKGSDSGHDGGDPAPASGRFEE